MFNFKDFFLLSEGGAGGHMAHPFDLPNVKTGKDLLMVYYKTVEYLNIHEAPLKIDGINASIRLVEVNGRKQFAFYRGSKIDAETPITKDKLEARFENPGLVDIAKKVLGLFNAAIPRIVSELTDIGLWNDPMTFLNIEYVSDTSNVVQYGKNFLVIHYPAKIIQKTSPKRNSISYTSQQIPYNKTVLGSLIKKIQELNIGDLQIEHQFSAKLIGKPNFVGVLTSMLTLNGETDSLRDWLNKVTNPKDKTITTVDGKTISAISQALYISVVEQKTPLESIIEPSSITEAINGLVFWHATRLLGKAILDEMDSPLGFASQQEGVVINSEFIAPEQFKITGDFFVKNALYSPHRKRLATKVVVIYPGRFQPFHKGHAAVYNKLKADFPNSDVYITTSDKVEVPNSPFNFSEKLLMIEASGINKDVVKKVEIPYVSKEALAPYDQHNTVLVIAVGKKDMEGPQARFTFSIKRDGTSSYYQPYTSLKNCQSMGKHGYVMIAETAKFEILGSVIDSASAIRSLWQNTSENQKKGIIAELYGEFSPVIFNLFNRKLK